MGASTLHSTENLHVRIFDWLNSTFPNPANRFVNGAQGGVGSGYFGWCFSKSPCPDDRKVKGLIGRRACSRDFRSGFAGIRN